MINSAGNFLEPNRRIGFQQHVAWYFCICKYAQIGHWTHQQVAQWSAQRAVADFVDATTETVLQELGIGTIKVVGNATDEVRLGPTAVASKELGAGKNLLLNLCGRGDKDMIQVAQVLGDKMGVKVEEPVVKVAPS